jgi:hypothetical protein
MTTLLSSARFVMLKENPEFGNHSPWRIEDSVDGQVMTRGLSELMALELLDLMNRAFLKGCKLGDVETAQLLEALGPGRVQP